MLSSTYALNDQQEVAQELLNEYEERKSSQYVHPITAATAYRAVGDLENTLAQYEKATEEPTTPFLFLLRK